MTTPPLETPLAPQGFVAPGFEPVRERFASNFQERGEVGASFAATLDGEPIVDLWGGVRDSQSGAPWEEDTLCIVYSGTKGLTAICMLQLIERGLLALDAPVCEYWPEFAAHGKEDVLVRHVVSHQAGLPGLRSRVSHEDVTRPEHIAALLADQELFWPAGSRMWYHTVAYGWLCAELLRRVAGESLGSWLRREVVEPLGLDMWIGLPEELEPRVAVCELAPGWQGIAADGIVGDISDQDYRDVWLNPDFFPTPLPWNTRAWHACEIAAANAITNARAMATVYGVLAAGGRRGDVVILRPETIALGQQQLADGVDPVVGERMTFGVGWRLQNDEQEMGPPAEAFGHSGAGRSRHGAWPQEHVGFSYVMNSMRDDDEDDRGAGLLEALYACVHAR